MTQLQTYRYPVGGWWTVVLAKDIADALRVIDLERIGPVHVNRLQVWNGKRYVQVMS